MAKMGRESNKTIGMRGLFLKMGWIKKYIACSFLFGNHVVSFNPKLQSIWEGRIQPNALHWN